MDKYRLENGNLCLIIEDAVTHRQYHVEFRDNYKGLGVDNLLGLLEEPFVRKPEYLDRFVRVGADRKTSMAQGLGVRTSSMTSWSGASNTAASIISGTIAVVCLRTKSERSFNRAREMHRQRRPLKD